MPLRNIHKPLSLLIRIFVARIRSPFSSSHFLKKPFPSAKRSFVTATQRTKDEVGGFCRRGVFRVAAEVDRLAVGFQELRGRGRERLVGGGEKEDERRGGKVL